MAEALLELGQPEVLLEERQELVPEETVAVTVTMDELRAEASRCIQKHQNDTFVRNALSDLGYDKFSEVGEAHVATLYETIKVENDN